MRRMTVCLLFLILTSFTAISVTANAEDDEGDKQAREVIQKCIDALGGNAYLQVDSVKTYGRYFRFRKGRKSFSRFTDWTVFEPVKWRFQLGEGKRRFVQIINLEENKGWTLEGKATIEEVPEEGIADFKRSVKHDLDLILRKRLDEEGMELFYYGPDDIAGQGTYEAVEFIDAANNSIVVYFDRESHLPAVVESHFTDDVGVRHKQEQEFANWHVFDGVTVALRYDIFVDDELSTQRFIEELTINPQMPDSYFLKPVIEDD